MYDLVGVDGNAYSIMAYVQRALKNEKVSAKKIRDYLENAMSENYDNLICLSMNVLERLNEEKEEE